MAIDKVGNFMSRSLQSAEVKVIPRDYIEVKLN